jgi:hypothetical protein
MLPIRIERDDDRRTRYARFRDACSQRDPLSAVAGMRQNRRTLPPSLFPRPISGSVVDNDDLRGRDGGARARYDVADRLGGLKSWNDNRNLHFSSLRECRAPT